MITSSPIVHRIHVIGNSCAGKSTLAKQLSEKLGIDVVELDALNWEPNWVGLNDTDPTEFERRISQATAGEEWVVAGSYEAFSKRVFWQKLTTVIWLDLPLRALVTRMIKRSWQRSQSGELLWGNNVERFWPQLMVWRKEDSLLWWIVTQYHRKRRNMKKNFEDPQWQHINFICLQSSEQISDYLKSIKRSTSAKC